MQNQFAIQVLPHLILAVFAFAGSLGLGICARRMRSMLPCRYLSTSAFADKAAPEKHN